MRTAFAFAVAVWIALASLSGAAGGADALGVPTPIPQASQTPPPDVAASPTPAALLVNGQMIDFERGFIVFASGDAFKVAQTVTVLDDTTGAPPTYPLDPGLYAVVELDAATALVTAVRLSRHPLPEGTPAAKIPHQYVAEASAQRMNPDLVPSGRVYSSILSKSVTVSITVEVPAETPFGDDVYMTTDTSGWNPLAIKLQRIDGRHFRIVIDWPGGTELHYLFTRGSWRSVERDRAGLQRQPRSLFVPGGDSMTVDLTVQRWADLP